MAPGTGDLVPFPAFPETLAKNVSIIRAHECTHILRTSKYIVLGHFTKHNKECHRTKDSTFYTCLCLEMVIAHSASSILPRGSAGHIPPDRSLPPSQAIVVALVGPARARQSATSSLAPSPIQKGRIIISAPPVAGSTRLAEAWRHLAGLFIVLRQNKYNRSD